MVEALPGRFRAACHWPRPARLGITLAVGRTGALSKSVNWMWDAAHPAAPVACTAMTPAPHYGFPVGSFRRECNVGGE